MQLTHFTALDFQFYAGFPPEIYDSAQVGVVDGCDWLIDLNININT